MVKGFKYFSIFLFSLGILLMGLSFFGSLSIWYGIEIAKSSMYIFIIGMFFGLVENQSKNQKNEVRKTQIDFN